MAHQCLKCGKTYPDGSPQILRGCEGCKGTRFFYTDAPLGAGERQELAQRADLDIERLALGKGADGPPRGIPTKGELPIGAGRDWVELGPNYLRHVVEDVVKRAHDRKPVFRVGGEPTPTLVEWVRGQSGDPSPVSSGGTDEADAAALDGLVDPERERAWRAAAHGSSPAEPQAEPEPEPAQPAAGEEVVYQRPRQAPRPVSLAGVELETPDDAALRQAAQQALDAARRRSPELAAANLDGTGEDASIYPEGQAPETVAVKDAGVYELDVKRLLEKQPIVVHRDGTYALHLPSLMETLKRRP